MRKKLLCKGFAVLWLTMMLSSFAMAELNAVRTLPAEYYMKNTKITIKIKVTGDAIPAKVTEQPPAGWVIKQALNGGVIENGAVVWDATDFTGALNLSYSIQTPTDASQNGVFTGKVNDIEIGGMNTLYAQRATPGKQFPMQTGLYYSYWVYLPENYGKENKKWPMILFLHGVGENGTNLEAVKTHGPPKLLATAANKAKFPELFDSIVISPQCTKTWWMNSYLDELMAEILKNYDYDKNHVYITGLSMGGFGTYSYASEHPDLFAAAIPIAGANDAKLYKITDPKVFPAKLEKLVNLPIWAFHGAKDSTILLKWDQTTVDTIKSLGGTIQFTIYPTLDHDCWTVTYSNEDIYKWLFQQSKTPVSVDRWQTY